MNEAYVAANPFGMMLNPEAILNAVNQSDRLERLQRRIYRPLDRPMIPKVGGSAADMADAEIDNDVDAPSEDVHLPSDMSDVIAVGRDLEY